MPALSEWGVHIGAVELRHQVIEEHHAVELAKSVLSCSTHSLSVLCTRTPAAKVYQGWLTLASSEAQEAAWPDEASLEMEVDPLRKLTFNLAQRV